MQYRIKLGRKGVQTVGAGVFKAMGKFQQEIGSSLDKLSAYDYFDVKILSYLYYHFCCQSPHD